jgi:hypothetical protein
MQCKIIDAEGTAGSNNITVGRNSQPIMGSAADLTISTNSAALALVFYDGTFGWRLKYND